MSPFGAWLLVSEQLHYITNREEIVYFAEKTCRIYAACGVSQTPITLIQKRRALDMIKMDYLRLLVDEAQGKYIDWRNFL